MCVHPIAVSQYTTVVPVELNVRMLTGRLLGKARRAGRIVPSKPFDCRHRLSYTDGANFLLAPPAYMVLLLRTVHGPVRYGAFLWH